MTIHRFENSVFNSNSYIINDGPQAVIVDIGDFNPLVNFINEHNLDLVALFITHTHYDHIYGIKEFMHQFPDIPIYTSEFGKIAFSKPNWNFSRYHDDNICIISDKIVPLQNKEVISISEALRVTAIATPGHDLSCISFRIDDALFTGDSFIPGIKVVDTFPKSDKLLAAHWYSILQGMAETYNIYPGHGPEKLVNK